MSNKEVMRVSEQAYTAKQMREILDRMDDDARVFFVCNYGDRQRTQQALPVSEVVESDTGLLAETGYSQSGIALVDEEYLNQCDNATFPVVILRHIEE